MPQSLVGRSAAPVSVCACKTSSLSRKTKDRIELTSMMHHNHGAYAHKVVQHHEILQRIRSDATARIADDGGFCGCVSRGSQHLRLEMMMGRNARLNAPPYFGPKKASLNTRTSMHETITSRNQLGNDVQIPAVPNETTPSESLYSNIPITTIGCGAGFSLSPPGPLIRGCGVWLAAYTLTTCQSRALDC